MPSCLTLVNAILKEIGAPGATSLYPGNKNSDIVLEALNDVTADIYNRGRFEFQKTDYTFALVAGQNEYALPADFIRMQLPLRVTGSTMATMIERTAEEYWSESYGSPSIVATSGSPRIFYVGAGKIHFWPAPDAGYIANAPNLTYTYFKNVPARMSNTDGASSIDLPIEFYDAVKKYGKARIKEYLGFDDFTFNYQQYEQALQVQQNRARQGLKSAQFRPKYLPMSIR